MAVAVNGLEQQPAAGKRHGAARHIKFITGKKDPMMIVETDRCPYCRISYEIALVKFRALSVVSLTRCPNCAFVPDVSKSVSTGVSIRTSPVRSPIGRATKMVTSLNRRYKAVLLFVCAAILTAAFLRHDMHVYWQISPHDIRVGSLAMLAVAVVVCATWIMTTRRST